VHLSVRSDGGFVWFGTSRMGGGIRPIFFAIFTLAILIMPCWAGFGFEAVRKVGIKGL